MSNSANQEPQIISSVEEEKPILLDEIMKKYLPGYSFTTVRNWAKRGHNGVYMRQWRIGGRIFSSIKALDEFTLGSNGGNGCAPPAAQSMAHKKAEKALDAMGVG